MAADEEQIFSLVLQVVSNVTKFSGSDCAQYIDQDRLYDMVQKMLTNGVETPENILEVLTSELTLFTVSNKNYNGNNVDMNMIDEVNILKSINYEEKIPMDNQHTLNTATGIQLALPTNKENLFLSDSISNEAIPATVNFTSHTFGEIVEHQTFQSPSEFPQRNHMNKLPMNTACPRNEDGNFNQRSQNELEVAISTGAIPKSPKHASLKPTLKKECNFPKSQEFSENNNFAKIAGYNYTNEYNQKGGIHSNVVTQNNTLQSSVGAKQNSFSVDNFKIEIATEESNFDDHLSEPVDGSFPSNQNSFDMCDDLLLENAASNLIPKVMQLSHSPGLSNQDIVSKTQSSDVLIDPADIDLIFSNQSSTIIEATSVSDIPTSAAQAAATHMAVATVMDTADVINEGMNDTSDDWLPSHHAMLCDMFPQLHPDILLSKQVQ